MKKKNNDFFALLNELEKENQSFKQLNKEYEQQKAIIDKIIENRKSKNLSQRDLAKMTGLKQPAIARFESFDASPNLVTLNKIVSALDLKLEVIDRHDSMKCVYIVVNSNPIPTKYDTNNINFINDTSKGENKYEYYKFNPQN